MRVYDFISIRYYPGHPYLREG